MCACMCVWNRKDFTRCSARVLNGALFTVFLLVIYLARTASMVMVPLHSLCCARHLLLLLRRRHVIKGVPSELHHHVMGILNSSPHPSLLLQWWPPCCHSCRRLLQWSRCALLHFILSPTLPPSPSNAAFSLFFLLPNVHRDTRHPLPLSNTHTPTHVHTRTHTYT
jgi:hypothetical protein